MRGTLLRPLKLNMLIRDKTKDQSQNLGIQEQAKQLRGTHREGSYLVEAGEAEHAHLGEDERPVAVAVQLCQVPVQVLAHLLQRHNTSSLAGLVWEGPLQSCTSSHGQRLSCSAYTGAAAVFKVAGGCYSNFPQFRSKVQP